MTSSGTYSLAVTRLRRNTSTSWSGALGGLGGTRGAQRAFRITAGFAEHDARFGASVSLYAQLASARASEEAVRLVWPAVVQETAGALGAGDWQPSLNWLDVVELRPDTRDARAG